MSHITYIIYTQQIWEWTFIFELLVGLLNILNALTWVIYIAILQVLHIQLHDTGTRFQNSTNMYQHATCSIQIYRSTHYASILHQGRPSATKGPAGIQPAQAAARQRPGEASPWLPWRGWGCVQMRQGVVERISDISAWLRCLKLWRGHAVHNRVAFFGPRDVSWEMRGDLQPNDCSDAVPQLSVMWQQPAMRTLKVPRNNTRWC